MNEKENIMSDSTALRQENDINSFQASNVKQLNKEKSIKNSSNQPGLRATNLNQIKKVEKEGKSGKQDKQTVKATTKETGIEKIRHSPLKREELPLFVEYEKKQTIHIHHKSSTSAVKSPVLPAKEDTSATDKLNDELKGAENEKQALTKQLKAAETDNREKNKKLDALRLETKAKTKQLVVLDKKLQQIKEYKTRNQSLKLKVQEQHDMYKELVDILSNANEEGLSFEQELQPNEDAINELLNQISEVNYRILELKETKNYDI